MHFAHTIKKLSLRKSRKWRKFTNFVRGKNLLVDCYHSSDVAPWDVTCIDVAAHAWAGQRFRRINRTAEKRQKARQQPRLHALIRDLSKSDKVNLRAANFSTSTSRLTNYPKRTTRQTTNNQNVAVLVEKPAHFLKWQESCDFIRGYRLIGSRTTGPGVSCSKQLQFPTNGGNKNKKIDWWMNW